ncbi:hypothetical protein CKO45_01100 [Paracraurococcus ruber]|uniref:histidine kinase n=2 Tax=Paracraurococcus ruber TaxID=77675 RepID=A0ABS1CR34_9PROT|nr:hypothetical protein [Paracraurococcus ruber]
MLAIGVFLARRISLSVLRPITELLRFAARPDTADPAIAMPPHSLPEADRLAEALLDEAHQRRAATASLLDSERRMQLVVAELNHRAKNALATVQSLAMQTARGCPDNDLRRFIAAFTGRLQSLARAHDLLTASAWEGAPLDAVVRAGLAVWIGESERDSNSRIAFHAATNTPMPHLAPGQVQALIMGLHELAVNAGKYGALSVPGGHVQVSFNTDPGTLAAIVEWREVGGPSVLKPPEKRGFGTRLLERALAHDLGPGAKVTLEFRLEGLHAAIRFVPRPAVHAADVL